MVSAALALVLLAGCEEEVEESACLADHPVVEDADLASDGYSEQEVTAFCEQDQGSGCDSGEWQVSRQAALCLLAEAGYDAEAMLAEGGTVTAGLSYSATWQVVVWDVDWLATRDGVEVEGQAILSILDGELLLVDEWEVDQWSDTC